MIGLRRPDQVLRELGITEPEDIDLEAIAQYCGATVVYRPLAGCEARIVGLGDRAIITVNDSSNEGRRRFSAGHELGHWMRDRGKVAFSCTARQIASEWSGENPERRANEYAADLLLPRLMFQRDTHARDISFATVRDVAVRYRTSLTATAIRLVDHGPAPAMLVCLAPKRSRWLWFRTSPDVGNLWPRDRPGPETSAHELLSGVASRPAMEVAATGWFDGERPNRLVLWEDSMAIGGELVLSLLSWRKEEHLLALLGEEGANASDLDDGDD